MEESEHVLVAQTLSFMKTKEERSWQMHASPSQNVGAKITVPRLL